MLIALVSLASAIFHLKQNVDYFYDFVALLVVGGGTFAVAVITLPWEYTFEIFRSLKNLISPQSRRLKGLAIASMNFIRTVSDTGRAPTLVKHTKSLALDTLCDGAELMTLGFDTKKIEIILSERIHHRNATYLQVAMAMRSLAKYPPAFGLVGTVLGLVSLMRSVSEGAPTKEIGVRMAVALVATLYGLLVANLLISPAGENIVKLAMEEKKEAELALQAVVLASEGVSLLEAQEVINSYLPKADRINIVQGLNGALDDAA